jgi:hypothetical protein
VHVADAGPVTVRVRARLSKAARAALHRRGRLTLRLSATAPGVPAARRALTLTTTSPDRG